VGEHRRAARGLRGARGARHRGSREGSGMLQTGLEGVRVPVQR